MRRGTRERLRASPRIQCNARCASRPSPARHRVMINLPRRSCHQADFGYRRPEEYNRHDETPVFREVSAKGPGPVVPPGKDGRTETRQKEWRVWRAGTRKSRRDNAGRLRGTEMGEWTTALALTRPWRQGRTTTSEHNKKKRSETRCRGSQRCPGSRVERACQLDETRKGK
jgi:hypothetical protein